MGCCFNHIYLASMVVYEATFIHFVFTHSYPESSREKIFLFLQPLIDELIDLWLMIYKLMMLRQNCFQVASCIALDH